jgi:hypothetical protein
MGLGDWKMESYRSPSLINLNVMAVNKEWLRSYLAGRRSCLLRGNWYDKCCRGVAGCTKYSCMGRRRTGYSD